MKKEKLTIKSIPAILWGETSKKGYLYVHGKGGNKDEAELFAKLVCD